MMKHNTRQAIFAAIGALALLMLSTMSIASTRATTPYHITLSVSNFSSQALSASADDVSDPAHAMFSLQNGTSFWYGITVQSTPTGMTLTPANAASDLVTTTFSSPLTLLPPIGILPFDQTGKANHFEALRLMAAFSGPNQQIQLDLSPFEPHAITLDICTFVLQLLGEKSVGTQIGLLAPGALKELFAATSTMKDFSNVTNSYIQVLQSNGATSGILSHAYDFSKALVAMLTDEGEQKVLSDVLWKIMGKAIPASTILKTITSFAGVQYGLGVEGFIRDESQLLAPTLIQQNDPTVLLQSIANTAQSGSTATTTTTTTVIPTIPVTPKSNLSPTPVTKPTFSPTRNPSPVSVHSPTAVAKHSQ
ncbi:MAG: hypothetical protein ACR2H5_10305 [Ktedonobacteraceae bacterium]